MRYFQELGGRLLALGYPIIPVRGKAPYLRGWTDLRLDAAQYARLATNGAAGDNVGVLAAVGDAPVTKVEIDCTDEGVVRALQDWCEAHLGVTVELVGAPPKAGLIYRCPEGMPKVIAPRYRDHEGRTHGVEILGKGTQFVAYGRHPAGHEYTQGGLLGDLLTVPPHDLPAITPDQVDDLIAEWCRLCDAAGWTRVGDGARAAADDDDYIPDPPTSLTDDEVRALIMGFSDEADDYHTWITMGQALHHQYQGGEKGLELWDTWSQHSGKHRPGVCEEKWATFGQQHGRPVTLRAYLARAKREPVYGRIRAILDAAASVDTLLHDAAPAVAALLGAHPDARPLALQYLRERHRAITGAAMPAAVARRILGPRVVRQGGMTADQRRSLAALPLERDPETGAIKATLGNVCAALRSHGVCGVWLSRDDFLGEMQISEEPGVWRSLTDEDMVALRVRLEDGGMGFRAIGRELMRDAVLLVCRENVRDSALAWLLDLPPWDGVARVDGFLSTYCGAEDAEYTRAASRYLWSALAGRIIEPGCQVDMVPVLIGAQGAGKTSLLRTMAPMPEHYAEVHLGQRDDDLARMLLGVIVAEIGEMTGMRHREIESLKAFITRRYEKWVPKYREMPQRYARRFVLIGTSNTREILEDDTGNRRWLPVEVGAIDLKRLAQERDQIWAEAKHIYDMYGVEWHDAHRLAPTRHTEYEVRDSWEELISEWIGANAGDGHGWGTHDILRNAVGLSNAQMDRRAELRAARIMRRLQYEKVKVRIGKATLWRWRK